MPIDFSTTKDLDLISETKALRDAEHASMTRLLQHLIEIEKRRLDLDLGYSSLFDYCVHYLEYSASAAGRRIQAARCIRRYPLVLEMLEKHELSLSTISQVEPILNDDNYKSILERVRGASHRKVESIACEYRPPIRFRDRVRPVRVARGAAPTSHDGARGAASVSVEKKMLIQFLADNELVDALEEARRLLSAGNPNVSFADVIRALADEYLERHSPVARNQRREKKRREANPDSQRRECKSTGTRHIPDNVRDGVFVRDGGQCTYVAPDGTRCRAKHSLHIDHVRPFATGGGHEPDNLRLLCAAHNRRVAERSMGQRIMASYWRRP